MSPCSACPFCDPGPAGRGMTWHETLGLAVWSTPPPGTFLPLASPSWRMWPGCAEVRCREARPQECLLPQPRSSCKAHLALLFHPRIYSSFFLSPILPSSRLVIAFSHTFLPPSHISLHPSFHPHNLCHPLTHLPPHSFIRHLFSDSSLHPSCHLSIQTFSSRPVTSWLDHRL